MANKNILIRVLFHQLIETNNFFKVDKCCHYKQTKKSYVMISILNLNLYAATKVM